ncbi:MFS transporter [Puia dinghuensis]|uniref:MFS transporter n=1 Tax=Puia dinghuensis TaxID=1792502 RepID=A0A8J2UC87_9BACT|nr:MFS transporter [Puia dinghuensis]GGA97105.1 MFS transporter [Puia dinghuensis]
MNRLTAFRAMHSRNYRLYFYGQSVSLIGTWMQRTAVSWVVYTLTHSSFMLGLSLFCTQFPSFLLSTAGGVVSDRYDRFRVLLFTQAASGVQSLLLAILIFTGHYNVWVILGLGVVLGSINAFDVPARQAMVYDMVDDKENLPNALALNSTMVNLARLVGPAIAGFILHKLGDGVCFALNAASFIAVIISLLRMKLPPYVRKIHKKAPLTELKDGWHYLRNTPSIARVILMLAAMSLFVIPYATLLPIYAKVIFHGNAATFGVIDSFIGLGAISGALYLASRTKNTTASRKKILRTNTIIFGVGLICFSYTSYFPLAMLFAVVAGFGMMAQTTITNTIIQTTVAPEMRGRVISYFAMSYFGMMPLGSLLVGTVSQYAGAQNTVLGEGLVALVVVAIYWKYLTTAARDHAKTAAERTSATVKQINTDTTWKKTARL